jgi:hypothetical protein
MHKVEHSILELPISKSHLNPHVVSAVVGGKKVFVGDEKLKFSRYGLGIDLDYPLTLLPHFLDFSTRGIVVGDNPRIRTVHVGV